MTCKFGALTLDGGNSSNTLDPNSLTSRMPTRYLMLKEEKMRKDKLWVFGVTIRASIKDGESFILIKLIRQKQKV
jgi:hypothetical protein